MVPPLTTKLALWWLSFQCVYSIKYTDYFVILCFVVVISISSWWIHGWLFTHSLQQLLIPMHCSAILMTSFSFVIFRTKLFRDFKLCKLLVRPLGEDHPSGSRRSSRYTVRGYSRQTQSYMSSLSNSADNSGNEDLDDEDETEYMWGDVNESEVYSLRRPGSRAVSLPTRLGLGRWIWGGK